MLTHKDSHIQMNNWVVENFITIPQEHCYWKYLHPLTNIFGIERR